MSRLALVQDLLDAIRGVNLDPWQVTSFGSDTTGRDALLEGVLRAAEATIEGEAGTCFTPAAPWIDTLSGTGSTSIHVKRGPLLDVQAIQVRQTPPFAAITIPVGSVRLDRLTARISIVPGFNLVGAAVPPGLIGYVFTRGDSNVLVQYRSGYSVVGSNLSSEALLTDPYPAIGLVSTDGSYAYFDLSEPYGLYKSGTTVSSGVAGKVLKDGADDSANWTMVSPTRLRVPIGSYSASARYVFVYVPTGVSQAVAASAAADMLRSKGAADGGVTSLAAGPFKEDYGTMRYGEQIRQLEQQAHSLIRPYRRAMLAVA